MAPAPSQRTLSTLDFLHSHSHIPRLIRDPDYDYIKRSLIDWFFKASQAERSARRKDNSDDPPHEYADLVREAFKSINQRDSLAHPT
jgi:hypothetical protein